VDPAPAVIEQLVRVLDIQPTSAAMSEPLLEFYSSGDAQQVAERVERLLGWNIRVNRLAI
jgi:hypothetical protein